MLCDQCDFYSWPTAQGNTLTALSTPGTGGQLSTQPGGLLSLQGMNQPERTPIPSSQSASNTSTSPNAPFNPLSLSSCEAYGSEVPGYLASTVGGLVNWALTPYGFTPGGAPLAGGQFPNNYPFTQEGINP